MKTGYEIRPTVVCLSLLAGFLPAISEARAFGIAATLTATPAAMSEGSSSDLNLSLVYTPPARLSGGKTTVVNGTTRYDLYWSGDGYIKDVSGSIVGGNGQTISVAASGVNSRSYSVTKTFGYPKPGATAASINSSVTCLDLVLADVYTWNPLSQSWWFRFSDVPYGTEQRTMNYSASRSLTVSNKNPSITNYEWSQPVVLGEPFEFTVTATDPGGIASNETMTFSFDLDDDGAYDDLTPIGNRLSVTGVYAFETPGTHPIRVRLTDGQGGTATGSFNITVGNEAPTIETIAPTFLECVNGVHTVELSTKIDDPDGLSLDATWYVQNADGVFELQKSETSLELGAVVYFEYDYSHGETAVRLDVSDGYDTTSSSTTVTVQDTEAPIVIVAADVEAPTDPGKDFATGIVLTPPTATDASGHPVTITSDAPDAYRAGQTIVTWTATDSDGNQGSGAQKVTVVDREAPLIAEMANVRTFCDPGKLFATVALPKPVAADNVPKPIDVTTTAGSRFPIGTTNVVWKATDAAGNASTSTQKVTVVNRKPKANAGKNLTITTTSEEGAKVALDGSRSSDPDKHKLKYAWKAPRVKFAKGKTANPSGLFKLGVTKVTLTVTDAGGLKSLDTMTVTVKLKNGTHRPRGSAANGSFAAAAQQAHEGVASGAVGAASLAGLAYANAAVAYGDAAGECVQWQEGESEADAALSYAELRAMQQAYGQAAAGSLLSAYVETADEGLLSAYGYAVYGTAYAVADLSEK
jgi:hypothetical protein